MTMNRLMRLLDQLRCSPLSRYVAPFLVFVTLTYLQGLGKTESVFWIYGIKVLVTGVALLYCFKGHWREIEGGFDWRAVGLGLIVLILWLLPEVLFPKIRPVTFDPTAFDSVWEKVAAIAIRMTGAVLIAPLVEEMFFRSFLMRWLIKQNFLSVPLGAYTVLSFGLTSISFALLHAPWEWGVALIAGVLYGGYLVKTKNLMGCIIAHATTNLGLGIYVVLTGEWKFW